MNSPKYENVMLAFMCVCVCCLYVKHFESELEWIHEAAILSLLCKKKIWFWKIVVDIDNFGNFKRGHKHFYKLIVKCDLHIQKYIFLVLKGSFAYDVGGKFDKSI